jgi:hypothetical protein
MEHLASLSYTDILQQPLEYEKERVEIQKRMDRLLLDSYPTLLQCQSKWEELHQKQSQLDLQPLVTLFHRLQDHITQVESMDRTPLQRINVQRIEEVLDIPSFFEILLRGGYFEQALDVQSFSHRHQIWDLSTGGMVHQILALLTQPCTLGTSVRIVGYLRRLGCTETQIHVLFLVGRVEYIRHVLSLVKDPKPEDAIRRTIETHREHLFDLITHYKAMFPTETKILHSFVVCLLEEFFTSIQERLECIEDLQCVPSIHMQWMYYGMSMGRLGMDFRCMAVEYIQDTVLRVATQYLERAEQEFVMIGERLERPLNKTPEHMLMVHPPLAISFNFLMSGFNQLRYVPIMQLHPPLSRTLIRVLNHMIAKCLESPMMKRDTEIVAWILRDVVIPRAIQGLDRVLCGQTPVHHIHVDKLDSLAEMGKCGRTESLVMEAPMIQEDSASLEPTLQKETQKPIEPESDSILQ